MLGKRLGQWRFERVEDRLGAFPAYRTLIVGALRVTSARPAAAHAAATSHAGNPHAAATHAAAIPRVSAATLSVAAIIAAGGVLCRGRFRPRGLRSQLVNLLAGPLGGVFLVPKFTRVKIFPWDQTCTRQRQDAAAAQTPRLHFLLHACGTYGCARCVT